MKMLSSVNFSLSDATKSQELSLTFQGLDPAKVIRRCLIYMEATLTRGSGGLAHTRQSLDHLLSLIEFTQASHHIIIDGHRLNLLFALRNARPIMTNEQSIATSGTAIKHFWEVPLSPPVNAEKGYRPRSESLNGKVIKVTPSLASFDTTATTGDILTAVGTLYLYVQDEDVPKQNYTPFPGGMRIESNSDFGGKKLCVGGNGFDVKQLIFETRTTMSSLNLSVGGKKLYETLTPLLIDSYQAEHLPMLEMDSTPLAAAAQGHPLLIAYPTLASKALSTAEYTVVYESRNHKDADAYGGELVVLAEGKGSTAIPYIVCGWQSA